MTKKENNIHNIENRMKDISNFLLTIKRDKMTEYKGEFKFLSDFLKPSRDTYFYETHSIDEEFYAIKYDNELLHLDEMDKYDLLETIESTFRNLIEHNGYYYEPLCYDPKIAGDCGFIPFTWVKSEEVSLKLLAPADTSQANFDAYQLLTSKTISPNSKIFSSKSSDIRFFKKAVGNEVFNKMQAILGGGNE